jgi:uncharacterized membrane protein YhaH (DUF805 family)
MKKVLKLILLITFLPSLYYVGSFIVDTLTKLFDPNLGGWIILIKVILWILTLSLTFFVTIFLYFIVVFIISLFIPSKK